MTGRDGLDARIAELVAELAEARPPVSALPDPEVLVSGGVYRVRTEPVPPRPPARWAGPAVAAVSFALVLVALAGLRWVSGPGVAGPAASAVDAAAAAAVDGAPVEFTTPDGVVLRGWIIGNGPTGVVVVPGYGTPAPELEGLAAGIADGGHTVLLFDLRGRGASGGVDEVAALPGDVLAAVRALRARGVGEVAVVGFRHGGTAALMAAAADQSLAGVAALHPMLEYQGLRPIEVVGETVVPKLYLGMPSSKKMSQAGWVIQLWSESAEPRSVETLASLPHDADLVEFYTPQFVAEVLEFLAGT